MAEIASSSAPSVIGLSMIAFTLDPLGVPTSVAIILLDENFEMKTQRELS